MMMSQVLFFRPLQLPLFNSFAYSTQSKLFPSYSRLRKCYIGPQSSLQTNGNLMIDTRVEDSVCGKAFDPGVGGSDAFPCIENLCKLSTKELHDKIVMVRFDSTILLKDDLDQRTQSFAIALSTISYLVGAGAKVILLSDWGKNICSKLQDLESVAEYLSSVLDCNVVPTHLGSFYKPCHMEGLDKSILLVENLAHVKGEVSNSSEFAKTLSSRVDIFINDSFSVSHKILASTVGITRFCHASVAGFHFEDSLNKVKNASTVNKRPYIAIVGGANLLDKAAALRFLVSVCDGLVFVGMMSFQILHALGYSLPLNLVEKGTLEEAVDLINIAKDRNIRILCPKDILCVNNHPSKEPKPFMTFPSHSIPEGWVPVDLGSTSLDEIFALITTCKKVIWIGPVKFKLQGPPGNGASELAGMLSKACQSGCDVTVVGSTACKAMTDKSSSLSSFHMIENATVFWEFLKGRKLPGVMALDRAFPFTIDWSSVYDEPAQPLVVDVGSGNGMFLLGMAERRKELNFLGLEINKKLVRRCLLSVHQSNLRNGYFIATNATSTFRSIVSSYPGDIFLVSIQCPNPDFNKPEHRWRMLQRSLVEAIADLLSSDGKVFLQSDVESVAVDMKKQFLSYGKGKLEVVQLQGDAKTDGGWLKENPFGVRSDWEQHVLIRGAPMYRLMLSKVGSAVSRFDGIHPGKSASIRCFSANNSCMKGPGLWAQGQQKQTNP